MLLSKYEKSTSLTLATPCSVWVKEKAVKMETKKVMIRNQHNSILPPALSFASRGHVYMGKIIK